MGQVTKFVSAMENAARIYDGNYGPLINITNAWAVHLNNKVDSEEWTKKNWGLMEMWNEKRKKLEELKNMLDRDIPPFKKYFLEKFKTKHKKFEMGQFAIDIGEAIVKELKVNLAMLDAW